MYGPQGSSAAFQAFRLLTSIARERRIQGGREAHTAASSSSPPAVMRKRTTPLADILEEPQDQAFTNGFAAKEIQSGKLYVMNSSVPQVK